MTRRRRRRGAPELGLSFLDCMSCGLGAVVLLYMIINHATVANSDTANAKLIASVNALEDEVLDGKQELLMMQAALDDNAEAKKTASTRAKRLRESIDQKQKELPSADDDTQKSRSRILALQKELLALEAEAERLRGQPQDPTGNASRQIVGEGDRQYLTGLKVGGRRVLILVDASASMLANSIVEAIRRRNMDDGRKRSSPKWRRTVATVEWLTAQIPTNSQFQIYGFNEKVFAVREGTYGKWLSASGGTPLRQATDALRQTVPGGGTSLHQAFRGLSQLSPRPDNVYLITDGLPTQGDKIRSGTVPGRKRAQYFNDAARLLPRDVTINVILLPMEGDPQAASAYWQLARVSGGAFLNPSEDWP